jgi:polyisoprenoid-binding protein YceI
MAKNKWIIDPAHSEIQFKVRHLMISTVTGYFKKFTMEAFTEDDDFSLVSDISFTIEADSLDTNNADRDTHLRSADFFDTETYNQIQFIGGSYERTGNAGKLNGELTIRGVTKPVQVNVEYGGIVVDTYGQTKAGFTVDGKLNRKEFGLTWGAITETGNVIVDDEVKFHGEIQLIKQ